MSLIIHHGLNNANQTCNKIRLFYQSNQITQSKHSYRILMFSCIRYSTRGSKTQTIFSKRDNRFAMLGAAFFLLKKVVVQIFILRKLIYSFYIKFYISSSGFDFYYYFNIKEKEDQLSGQNI